MSIGLAAPNGFDPFWAGEESKKICFIVGHTQLKIILRVAPSAIYGFSNSWFVKTGYARLFVRSTEICSRVRISGDVILDDVIAILRF